MDTEEFLRVSCFFLGKVKKNELKLSPVPKIRIHEIYSHFSEKAIEILKEEDSNGVQPLSSSNNEAKKH